MTRLILAVLLMALFEAEPALAKRAAPKPVAPVAYKGITYAAPNQDGTKAYGIASDSKGKELFRIKVFDVPIDQRLEEDVQWVFITDLKSDGESLLIQDEKGPLLRH
jgi:hypothetical protein